MLGSCSHWCYSNGWYSLAGTNYCSIHKWQQVRWHSSWYSDDWHLQLLHQPQCKCQIIPCYNLPAPCVFCVAPANLTNNSSNSQVSVTQADELSFGLSLRQTPAAKLTQTQKVGNRTHTHTKRWYRANLSTSHWDHFSSLCQSPPSPPAHTLLFFAVTADHCKMSNLSPDSYCSSTCCCC